MIVQLASVLLFAGGLQQAPACVPPEGYRAVELAERLEAGEPLRVPFGDRFAYVMSPAEHGWTIGVEESGRDENLARLTPPWHFVPNPRFIEGWHFRNAENTGPNEGSVNAPQELREFFFSPEVGRTFEYEGSGTPASTVEAVRDFGRGRVLLTSYALTPPARGERASFEEISFEVCLVWRDPSG